MTIDVHAHCIPSGLLELLRADGPSFGIEVVPANLGEAAIIAGRVKIPPFRPSLTDVDARLAHMDATGVQVQLLSSWIDLTAYALEPASGARFARRFNGILAEEAARHPDRFLALSTVPLQAPEAAAEELRYAVGELGMVGVEIATTVDGTDLDQAGLDPFWAAAADLRCLVLIHPYAPLAGVDLRRHFLDNLVGRPAETTIAVAHLVFSGVLDRHPDLIMCVVHGGGFFPYQVGRMRRGFSSVPHLAATHLKTDPEELARRLYYDTVLHSPRALGFLVDLVGAEHVVLGTDYPFEMGDDDPVTTIGAIPGLSEAQRRLILDGNVRRILDGITR